MSLKRICGIASWRGAAIGALAKNLRCETESRRRREWPPQQRLARWSALQSQPSSGCCCCACTGTRSAYRSTKETARLDSCFRCCNQGHRQEQKLIFTSLPWHVDLVGSCASRIFAHGRVPSSVRLSVDVFSFLLFFSSASGGECGRCRSVQWRGHGAMRPFLHYKFFISLTIAL